MPSASNVKYKDVVTNKTSSDLTKLPPIKPGYDSFFTITPKPKQLINPKARGVLRYASALSVSNIPLTLGEGGTPLIPSKVFKGVYIKNEGMNPTGNFKDRESVVALAYAHEQGYSSLAIASSGNAALSAAMYSRIYNLKTTCYIPNRTSDQKTDMIDFFGARTHVVGSTYEESYHYLLDNLPAGTINITSGAFPLRSDGTKTIAYEIWEDLGKVPDVIVCPAGNGSALAAIYHGFCDLKEWGYTDTVPMMVSVQIKGADPINRAFESGKWLTTLKDVPYSMCEAIVAEESFCSPKAVYAIKQSGGFGISVTDHQVIDGLRFAIDTEGVFPELSSASVFAAILEHGEKIQGKGKTVVLINSATGIKDTQGTRKVLER
jgi:threonine synthase